jgi:hypothetical protein
LHFYLLLRIAAKRTGGISLSPQPLNRLSNCSLIRRKCLPDGGIIVDILRHHVQDVREIYQRNKCRIEPLLLRCIGQRCARQPGVLLQPGINIQNLLRIRRCGGDLREQRIRIKSNRGEQLVQLFGCGRRGLRRENGAEFLRNHQRD